MKHFVQYHNAEKQGPLKISDGFKIFARKPIDRLVGHRVWLISGEGKTSPKKYYLRYTFAVDQVVSATERGFANEARGKQGRHFDSILLNELPWFKDFLDSQQNFSLGVREILTPHLEKLRGIASEI